MPAQRVSDGRLGETDSLALSAGIIHAVAAAISSRNDGHAIGPGIPCPGLLWPVDGITGVFLPALRRGPLRLPGNTCRMSDIPYLGQECPGRHIPRLIPPQAQAPELIERQLGELAAGKIALHDHVITLSYFAQPGSFAPFRFSHLPARR